MFAPNKTFLKMRGWGVEEGQRKLVSFCKSKENIDYRSQYKAKVMQLNSTTRTVTCFLFLFLYIYILEQMDTLEFYENLSHLHS